MIGGEFSACLFQHKRSTKQFKYLVRCFNCLAERFNFLAKNLHWKNRAKELIYKEHIDPDWNRGKTPLPSPTYHHAEPDIADNPNHQYQDKDYIGRNPYINQCILV